MYVCLCKALTESEVIRRARGCLSDGVRSPADIIDALELHDEETCGFCIENPEHILAIVEDEVELYLGYAAPAGKPV